MDAFGVPRLLAGFFATLLDLVDVFLAITFIPAGNRNKE
jgi:hypothetical protein